MVFAQYFQRCLDQPNYSVSIFPNVLIAMVAGNALFKSFFCIKRPASGRSNAIVVDYFYQPLIRLWRIRPQRGPTFIDQDPPYRIDPSGVELSR